MIETYLAGDRRGAWKVFMKTANIHLPDELFEAMFGGEIEGQAAADEHFYFAHMERPTTFWKPDLRALRHTRVNLVVGIGEDSANELCDRTSRALATESASSRHCSRADTPASPRTPRPSRRGSGTWWGPSDAPSPFPQPLRTSLFFLASLQLEYAGNRTTAEMTSSESGRRLRQRRLTRAESSRLETGRLLKLVVLPLVGRLCLDGKRTGPDGHREVPRDFGRCEFVPFVRCAVEAEG